MKKLLLAYFLLISMMIFSQEKNVYFYKSGLKRPVIYLSDFSSVLTRPISLFQKEIKDRSGLRITYSSQPIASVINVHFKIVKTTNRFHVVLNGKNLVVSASNEKGFVDAVNYMMNDYFSIDSNGDIRIVPKAIDKPINVSPFEYREVYFSQNFESLNRQFYQTNYLELEWGLWGHNIRKWVKKEKVSEEIYALHNGKRHSDQLCFSSVELKKIIHKNIKQTRIDDASLKRFMIAPDDNNIVCQCHLCKAKGNTKKNASPAVYSLLSELAEEYRDLSFWSLGYVTTKTPPNFKLPSNVGVLLSTIDCQEALPLEETPKGRKFLDQIATWNSKIQNIFIWDYVVNFDNYMDFYPIFNTTKKNLNSYVKNGVTGVFLHGSGYDYSVLEEVKYHVISRLLLDPDAVINDLIREGVGRYYPELSNVLFDYLTLIEKKAIVSKKKQDIYSGIKKANRRYLSLSEIESLLKKVKNIHTPKINKLKIALLYLQLELMHVNGLKNEGFGVLDTNNQIQENPFIYSKLKELQTLVERSGLAKINEKKDTFRSYIYQWEKFLKRIRNNDSFYNINIRSFSTLDEDYSNIKVLNDGAFGFNNYNDNWLIFSGNELLLNINNFKCSEKEINKLEIGLLEDVKHRIFLPTNIQIFDKAGKLVKDIKMTNTQLNTSNVQTIEVLLPEINLGDKFSYNIKIVNTNKSIAIDEIRFLK